MPDSKPPRRHQPRNLIVRRLVQADMAAFVALVAAHQGQGSAKGADVLTPAFVRKNFLGRRPAVLALVAILEGAMTAYALLMPILDTAVGAEGLCVAEIYVDANGQRKSVGRTLLAACAAEAERQGKTYLAWTSKAWDVEGHDAYRRIGAIEEPVMAHLLPLAKVPRFVAEGRTMMPAKGLRKRRPART